LFNNLQLTIDILPDRPQAGSGFKNGSVELMIHRRLSRDDNYGMEEALNETGFDGKGLLVSGKHLLILNSIEENIEKV
jgi:lysosomal alpha-mannosidase